MSLKDGINKFKEGVKSVKDKMNFLKEGPVKTYKPKLSEILGPTYNYSSEIKTPGEIGIEFGNGSWDGINNAAAGIDYYGSVIGYGESTGMAAASFRQPKMTQHPLGVRYFIKTGVSCSNGADMYQYVNTIPGGLPGRLGKEIQNTLGVSLRGLAPGMFEDAAKALNPMPMFNAVMNTGYARCRKVQLPVGDIDGNIESAVSSKKTWWIDPSKEKIVYGANGKPEVAHWIFDSWLTAEEYNNTPKVYPKRDANNTIIESFQSFPLPILPLNNGGEIPKAPLVAGILFIALFGGLVAFKATQN